MHPSGDVFLEGNRVLCRADARMRDGAVQVGDVALAHQAEHNAHPLLPVTVRAVGKTPALDDQGLWVPQQLSRIGPSAPVGSPALRLEDVHVAPAVCRAVTVVVQDQGAGVIGADHAEQGIEFESSPASRSDLGKTELVKPEHGGLELPHVPLGLLEEVVVVKGTPLILAEAAHVQPHPADAGLAEPRHPVLGIAERLRADILKSHALESPARLQDEPLVLVDGILRFGAVHQTAEPSLLEPSIGAFLDLDLQRLFGLRALRVLDHNVIVPNADLLADATQSAVFIQRDAGGELPHGE